MTEAEKIEQACESEWAKRRIMRKVWTWCEGFLTGVAWRDQNPKKMTVLEMVQMLENIFPSEKEIREFAKLEKLILAANGQASAESDENLRDGFIRGQLDVAGITGPLALVVHRALLDTWNAARANPDPRVTELVDAVSRWRAACGSQDTSDAEAARIAMLKAHDKFERGGT